MSESKTETAENTDACYGSTGGNSRAAVIEPPWYYCLKNLGGPGQGHPPAAASHRRRHRCLGADVVFPSLRGDPTLTALDLLVTLR